MTFISGIPLVADLGMLTTDAFVKISPLGMKEGCNKSTDQEHNDEYNHVYNIVVHDFSPAFFVIIALIYYNVNKVEQMSVIFLCERKGKRRFFPAVFY